MLLPRIGVPGGMGSAATILFQQRILDAVEVETDGGHLPLLLDINTQVSIAHRLSDSWSWREPGTGACSHGAGS